LADGNLSPQERVKIEKEITHLEHQMEGYKKDFKAMDKDPGKGFVAAEGQHKDEKWREMTRDVADDLLQRNDVKEMAQRIGLVISKAKYMVQRDTSYARTLASNE
jgi:hypothetical protein